MSQSESVEMNLMSQSDPHSPSGTRPERGGFQNPNAHGPYRRSPYGEAARSQRLPAIKSVFEKESVSASSYSIIRNSNLFDIQIYSKFKFIRNSKI
jgi:hypothetical protein